LATTHFISPQPLALPDLGALICGPVQLRLSPEAEARIVRCRDYLDEKIAATDRPIYGINTGFGSLYNKHIPRHLLEQLQANLVKSHACGTGPEVPGEVVMLMLFLKVQSLAYGYSGVQLQTVQRLADFFNHGVLPRIYEMGSLGASGDLAPLAHLALPLMGEGEVRYHNEIVKAKDLLAQKGWAPLHFKAKEGLALLNGTQFMSAYAVWCVWHAHRLLRWANTAAALSIDVFDGRLEPFDSKVQQIRAHAGQRQTAAYILYLLAGSTLAAQPKQHVQDPYSFRCVPQVHGASADTIAFVTQTALTEVNSVTDNPNIFPEADQIISGGNFHGQPLALALDFLAVALAELGSISERRTYQLISGARNLPNYLVANPGIHSGMMIPQYTAASLVSQNKQLCTPASVDSIVSSNGQEDHVSMGANAATKCYRVVQNVYSILAIEWLTAVQALHFRRPLKTAPKLEALVSTFRGHVTFMEEDRLLHDDMVKAEKFLRETDLT
jgi:histidine ammonia-lyase